MKELKPRERFERAIRREPVDRVPTLYRFKKESKEKVARIFGINNTGTGLKHDPTLELRLGNDAVLYQIGINAEFTPSRSARPGTATSESATARAGSRG